MGAFIPGVIDRIRRKSFDKKFQERKAAERGGQMPDGQMMEGGRGASRRLMARRGPRMGAARRLLGD